jgi:hypothetical protein
MMRGSEQFVVSRTRWDKNKPTKFLAGILEAKTPRVGNMCRCDDSDYMDLNDVRY